MTSHGVVFSAPNRAEIEEFETPSPGPGEVLLEAEYTLISPGTERTILSGASLDLIPLPARPGYSMVGTVSALGEGVERLAVGDRVVCHAAPHASHALAAEDTPVKVPDSVDSESAVFFNVAQTAQLGLRQARIEVGDSVAVLGQGPIGLIAVQLARLHGGCPVIAFDLAENRLELSRVCGADLALDPRDDDAVAKAMGELEGGGPAAVIELTARAAALGMALRIARPNGRVVLVGAITGGSLSEESVGALFFKGLELIGGSVLQRPWTLRPTVPAMPPSVPVVLPPPPEQQIGPGMWTFKKDIEVFLRMVEHGRLDMKPLITHRFDGSDAPKAFELLAAGDPSLIGCLFRWS